MAHKPWHILEGTTARCQWCGAISIWVPGVEVSSRDMGPPRPLSYWKWRRKFKQYHAHPEAGLDGPWFDNS